MGRRGGGFEGHGATAYLLVDDICLYGTTRQLRSYSVEDGGLRILFEISDGIIRHPGCCPPVETAIMRPPTLDRATEK
jgi:hypothetical protein